MEKQKGHICDPNRRVLALESTVSERKSFGAPIFCLRNDPFWHAEPRSRDEDLNVELDNAPRSAWKLLAVILLHQALTSSIGDMEKLHV
jgi:hypothetical protein